MVSLYRPILGDWFSLSVAPASHAGCEVSSIVPDIIRFLAFISPAYYADTKKAALLPPSVVSSYDVFLHGRNPT